MFGLNLRDWADVDDLIDDLEIDLAAVKGGGLIFVNFEPFLKKFKFFVKLLNRVALYDGNNKEYALKNFEKGFKN